MKYIFFIKLRKKVDWYNQILLLRKNNENCIFKDENLLIYPYKKSRIYVWKDKNIPNQDL